MTDTEEILLLRERLDGLRHQHRALDNEIEGIDGVGPMLDQFTLRRMKKAKLALKDEMQSILDRLHPDIIA